MLNPIQFEILEYMSKPTFTKQPNNITNLDYWTFLVQNKYTDVPNELCEKLHKDLYLIKSSLEALERDKFISNTYNAITDDGRAAMYLYKEANRKKNTFQFITVAGIILGLVISVIVGYEAILKFLKSIIEAIFN